MELKEGMVVKGTIEGIKKFGAFVKLENGQTGLLHISQIRDGYVKRVDEWLRVGEEYEFKILEIKEDGKIDLTLKDEELDNTLEKKEVKHSPRRGRRNYNSDNQRSRRNEEKAESATQDAEAMFQAYKRASDDRLSDLKRRRDRRQ